MDFLYLDNTFIDPDEDFPHQSEAYAILRDKISKGRADSKEMEFHIYCYTLGKEELFINLAKDLGTRIMISRDRWERLAAIGIADDSAFIMQEEQDVILEKLRSENATSEEIEANTAYVKLRPMSERPKDKTDVDKTSKVVHFMLSGWKKQYVIVHPKYCKIPYSSHSSYKEI